MQILRFSNDLQHILPGWPGGKPNADDTYRPERANPYPKRIIVFSPHPDDDVISMGGTLRRLVQQGHDVHVAYETSGNIRRWEMKKLYDSCTSSMASISFSAMKQDEIIKRKV